MRLLLFSLVSFVVTTMMAQEPIRFLALGDSYTIGESVAEQDRWPVQLTRLMREAGVNLNQPEIIATTGWTTDELSSAIDERKPSNDYGLVSLLIGVNNQYRGNSQEVYVQEFTALLNRAIEFAGGIKNHVVVVSIPDWGVTPFAADRDRDKIAEEIDAFNAINRKISASHGVHYVDITPSSRLAKTELDLVAGDGLHPSGKEYSRWAGKVFEEMKSVYQSK